MGLKYWFDCEVTKDSCPEQCLFSDEKGDLYTRPIVFIPPPEKTRIMLISRDPTVDFLPLYRHAMSKEYEEKPNERRLMLFASAIPLQLILRIARFNEREDVKIKRNIEPLFKIFKVVYWTHLHKCPTDNEAKFSIKCANQWLKEEIEEAKKEGVDTIVGLGKDVENWLKSVEDWLDKNGFKEKNIIFLPHPSGRNPAWHTKNVEKKKEINNNIEKLIRKVA